MTLKKTASQQGRASRAKGARFERELAKTLTKSGFPATRNARNGISTDDISHSIEGLHIEAKSCEKLAIPAWWKQAERDADGRDILLAIKQNRKEPIVVCTLEHYLHLRSQIRAV